MMSPNRIRVLYPPYSSGDVVDVTPIGRTYSDDTEMIAVEDRAASGKLRRDVVALKKTINLKYSAIDHDVLLRFENLLHQYIMVELRLEVAYPDNEKTYTVMMNPYSRERVLAVRGGLWSNVTITFVEV